MEDMADALKIAFAVFIFVIAITITFLLVSQAKTTSDIVLYSSDKTSYYDYDKSKEKDRTVKKKDVISALYKYYNESVSITVVIDDDTYIFDKGRESSLLDESVSLNTMYLMEKNLAKFITDKLPEGDFTEKFVEVPTSGIYSKGEDGTEITLSAGGKKVYVTYTKV